MGFAERKKIIEKIEKLRGSKIITYFTSDRRAFPPDFSLPALTARLGTEAQLVLYDQLRKIGKTEKIDLFLYTLGGQTDSVWPLVSIFREYAPERFAVLVPFRAHSAGTLIALGADEIVMAEAGELSPVDPTTANQFNPTDPAGVVKAISVEDVTSYIELAKDRDKVGLETADQTLEVFKRLSKEVHPIALGNVNRAHTQIRILARKLLKLHIKEDNGQDRIDRIVDELTKNLYSHTHALNRKEATALLGEEIVKEATADEQTLFWQLYEEYAESLKLRETFCRDTVVASGKPVQDLGFVGAFIDTNEQSMLFESSFRLRLSSRIPQGVQIQVPPGQPVPLVPGLPVHVNVEVLSIGWTNNQKGV